MNEPIPMYQLWCYYETSNKWVMEGFFRTSKEANERAKELRVDGDTPCMPDWHVIKVEGWW